LAGCLAAVAGFLLYSVALNDLSDAAIDRVNLPGDPRRPLASGAAAGRDMVVVAVTGGVVALGVSAALGLRVAAVTAIGLLLSAGYSLRPVRLADRGATAALVLPACYVAVPFLVAVQSRSPMPSGSDWLLLGGLYVGFIGRILLKDFRDVRGDALFGKRTFLVRHGRRWTVAFSAVCWSVGGVVLAVAANAPTPGYLGGTLLLLAAALVLLRALADERGARRDESLVAAIAVVGRGMLLLLLAQLSMTHAHWAPLGQAAVCGTLVAVVLGQAATMVRRGPISRYTVPASWSDAVQERSPDAVPLES
jgi:4-hydroxybenzoate polyprenyltransferase